MHYLLANGDYMRIRSATREDAEVVLSFFQNIVKETGFLKTTPEEAEEWTVLQEEKYIQRFEAEPYNAMLLAATEKELVGCLTLLQYPKKRQQHVADLDVNVLANYWNMGIARRLLNHLMNWIGEQSTIKMLRLEVLANNVKAVKLARDFGFKEEGRQKDVVSVSSEMYEDLILMGRTI